MVDHFNLAALDKGVADLNGIDLGPLCGGQSDIMPTAI